MTVEDARVQHGNPTAAARDTVLVVPGADPLTDGNGLVQVARWLHLCGPGTVTYDTLAGTGRTYTTVSGMAFPVKLEAYVVKVTASTIANGVYAFF